MFHHALEYAVELEELSANPLDRGKLRRPKSSGEIDRRVVVNPAQARELLVAVTYCGRTRHLPASGWSLLTLEKTAPQSNKRFTDPGKAHDERSLKHRDAKTTRPVPIPPGLVAILRTHLDRHGTAKDGRLFRTRTDGVISGSAYAKIWKEARTSTGLSAAYHCTPRESRPSD